MCNVWPFFIQCNFYIIYSIVNIFMYFYNVYANWAKYSKWNKHMKIHNELKEITKLSSKSPWLWAPYLLPPLLESQTLSSTKAEIFIKTRHQILTIFLCCTWFFKKFHLVIIIIILLLLMANSMQNYFYPHFYIKNIFTPSKGQCTFLRKFCLALYLIYICMCFPFFFFNEKL